MPKKMKFPDIPGDTPRERFMNLVRQVISVPKIEVDNRAMKRRRSKRRKARMLMVFIAAMLLFVPVTALAEKPNKLADCTAAATFARTIAHARDAGITS